MTLFTEIFKRTALAVTLVWSLLGASLVSAETTTLEVGYIPIMPMSQLFVAEGEGWLEEAGIKVNKTKFQSGPHIVTALASGELDVVYMGIGPAMVAKAKGIDIRVVASNVIEQIALVARGDLAEYMTPGADPKEAIAKFTADKGRKPIIASLPKGSVPDTVFRHWLIKVAGMKEDDIEIKGMGAVNVQQALLLGNVDGASILEPIVTIVQEREPTARVVVYGGDMLSNQPGAILAVRSELLKEKPEVIEKLIAAHKRATDLIINDPKTAAKHVQREIGKGLIPVALVEKAVTSPYTKFMSDPRQIIDATKVMHDFAAEIGTLKAPVPLDELFDTEIYASIDK